MKIWLDDFRAPPDASWTWVKTHSDFVGIWTLAYGAITNIAFDHDLGSVDERDDGYDCACMVEEWLHDGKLDTLPIMTCQSDNGPGRKRILDCIAAMEIYFLSSTQLMEPS